MDTITINGVTYDIPSEYSYYIIEKDNTLTLSRSGNITIYSSLQRYNDYYSGYPRIQISYGQTARYTVRSGQQTSTSDLTVSSWSVSHNNLLQDPMMSIYMTVVLAGALIWRLFKS